LFKQRSDGFGFALLFIHNTAGNSIKQPKHNLICPTVSFSQVLKIASGVTIVPAWVMARGGRLLAVQGQRRLETTLSQTSTNAGLLKLLPECPNNRMTIIMKKKYKKNML